MDRTSIAAAANPATNPADRRTLVRTPTTLRARVYPGGVDCLIRDYNKRGARLEFRGSAPLGGQKFWVVVWSTGMAFEAASRWRSGNQIGVQFTSGRDLRKPAPPQLEAAQEEWMGRQPRLSRRRLLRNPNVIDDKAARRGAWLKF